MSIVGTTLDILAGITDVVSVATVAIGTTVIGGLASTVAGPSGFVAAYAASEAAVQPLLQVGNILATGATAATVASDCITGNTGINLSTTSDKNGSSLNGEISLGTNSTISAFTTAVGWSPGMPSWGSLAIQSAAIANDFGAGDALLGDTSGTFSFNITSNDMPFWSYLPIIEKK